jgi:hypothetical protein
MLAPHRATCLVERIQHRHAQSLEVAHVARDHGETVLECRCGNHSVLEQRVRLPLHQLRANLGILWAEFGRSGCQMLSDTGDLAPLSH